MQLRYTSSIFTFPWKWNNYTVFTFNSTVDGTGKNY